MSREELIKEMYRVIDTRLVKEMDTFILNSKYSNYDLLSEFKEYRFQFYKGISEESIYLTFS